MSYIDIRLLHKFNIMRTTYNKLNNHALVFIEITKAWLFFIIIITKLANKANEKNNLLWLNGSNYKSIRRRLLIMKIFKANGLIFKQHINNCIKNLSAEDDMESKINELSNIIEKAINVK